MTDTNKVTEQRPAWRFVGSKTRRFRWVYFKEGANSECRPEDEGRFLAGLDPVDLCLVHGCDDPEHLHVDLGGENVKRLKFFNTENIGRCRRGHMRNEANCRPR